MNETKEYICEKCGSKMKEIEVFGNATFLQCTNIECKRKTFKPYLKEKPSDDNLLEESRN